MLGKVTKMLIIVMGLLLIFVILQSKNIDFREVSSNKRVIATSPPVGIGSQKRPLGYPEGQPISKSYSFLNYQKNLLSPVAWDPCRPIHYVINESNMPIDGGKYIKDVFEIYGKVTGYHFIYDGVSKEFYSKDRKSYQPELYGDRWAPILVTWSTITNRPDVPENVLGEGGATYASREGTEKIYVSGMVDLQIDHLKKYLGAEEGKFRAVILHEIGHALGLDHSAGAWDIMYPEDRLSVDELSLGDKAGLYILASQGCHPDI